MGVFKQFAEAFKPSNLKAGLAASGHQMTPEEREVWLASLDPETRAKVLEGEAQAAANLAHADAQFAQGKAESDAQRALFGPAGDYVYGVQLTESPTELRAREQAEGVGAILKSGATGFLGDLKNAAREELTGGKLPEITDPVERERVAAEQRAARVAARAPYLGPATPPIAITRLATRGKTQVEEVIAYLQQTGLVDQPHRVYGVYRVPDRISPMLTLHSESGRVVEWDLVHEPGAVGGGSPAPIDDAWFPANQQWVARRRGEPSILDEDLGVGYCLRAGIGPEQCLGIARHCEFTKATNEENDMSIVFTRVTGVHVFHAAGAGGDTQAQMAAEAPLPLGVDDVAGTVTVVLNAGAIRRAVHPRLQDPVPVPSPFPHLPASPQELLHSYLEVVGIRASDCYGAQVTVHSYKELHGRIFGDGSTNSSPKQPCADGKDRGRLHGAEHVVITHRDRPEYAEGRARWARYQEEVLQAHLERATGARATIQVYELTDSDNPLLRAGAALLQGAGRIAEFGNAKPPAPYRYCWPPIDG